LNCSENYNKKIPCNSTLKVTRDSKHD